MTGRIFVKLVFAVLLILALALAAIQLVVSHALRSTYEAQLRSDLAAHARLLQALPPELLKRQIDLLAASAGGCIQVRDASGAVTLRAASCPVSSSPVSLRHAGFLTGASLSVPYRDGGRLEIAAAGSELTGQVDAVRSKVIGATALAILPAACIALLFARHFSRKLGAIIAYTGQLARGNFEARLSHPSGDELGLLSRQLNETAEKLQMMFEELQREHQELEKLERVRKDFVINVSHELRTPLASIQGYAETLLDGALYDSAHNVRFLIIIRQNAERLARLTSDLLTLSRIEFKTQRFQFAAYYVNPLLADDVDTVRPMAEKNNVTIVIEPAPDEAEVFCDAEAVHQILANLLENALKYTLPGGVIHVGATVKTTASGEMVEFYVRDTGIGIPESELPRLFERFYRVDKARSRSLGGTGLGLAIVKHLVRAQGGEVRVTSQLNVGSTFSFTLPVYDVGVLAEGSRIQTELTAS